MSRTTLKKKYTEDQIGLSSAFLLLVGYSKEKKYLQTSSLNKALKTAKASGSMGKSDVCKGGRRSTETRKRKVQRASEHDN